MLQYLYRSALKPTARKYHAGGKQREITHLPEPKMSTLEVRALDRAKKEFARARKQLEVARLRSTTYRGVDYEVTAPQISATNKELTYRGVVYTS